MEKFKIYLESELAVEQHMLRKISKQIEDLPAPKDIVISDYDSPKFLKQRYKTDKKQSFIKRIIGPTKQQLQEYIRNTILLKLTNQKEETEKTIRDIEITLEQLQKDIKDNQKEFSSSTIRILLRYASIEQLPPEETKKILLSIISIPSTDINVDTKIKQNIRVLYVDGILKEEINTSTLKLLFEKLFNVILTEREKQKFELIVEQIINEVVLESEAKKEHSLDKEELQQRKENLKELQQYIDGLNIRETIDINEFKELLRKCNIDSNISSKLVEEMRERIEEEKKESAKKEEESALKKHLSDNEYELILKAEELEQQTTGQISELISRTKKDVISLCLYLNFIEQTNEYQDMSEVLGDRLVTLKNVLFQVQDENKIPNTLIYIPNSEGVPILLRDIEMSEITKYDEIYQLLKKLANKNYKPTIVTTKKDIEILRITGKRTKLLFTRNYLGIIAVIGLEDNLVEKGNKKIINKQLLNRINELYEQIYTPSFKELQSTYELLILDYLNLQDKSEPLTLKKTNKNK